MEAYQIYRIDHAIECIYVYRKRYILTYITLAEECNLSLRDVNRRELASQIAIALLFVFNLTANKTKGKAFMLSL